MPGPNPLNMARTAFLQGMLHSSSSSGASPVPITGSRLPLLRAENAGAAFVRKDPASGFHRGPSAGATPGVCLPRQLPALYAPRAGHVPPHDGAPAARSTRFNQMLARVHTPLTWAEWNARRGASIGSGDPLLSCDAALQRVRALRDGLALSGSGSRAFVQEAETRPPERVTLRTFTPRLDEVDTYLRSVRCTRKFWQAKEVEATVARPALKSARPDGDLPALSPGLADAMRANRLRAPEPARLEDLLRGQLPKYMLNFQQSHPTPRKSELHPTGMFHRYLASKG